MRRRAFVGAGAAALLAGCAGKPGTKMGETKMEQMYGLIGQMLVAPGKRGEVIAAMLAGTKDMPGNIAYLIAEDMEDENSIWITEVWQTKADHENSLRLPSVTEAIGKARPSIVGFGSRVETRPVIDG